MWLAGFRSTVKVAFVLLDKSVSVELWPLPEVSLRVEVLALPDSVMDGGVSNAGPLNDTIGSGDGCFVAEFTRLVAGEEVGSIFESSCCSTVFKESQCSAMEDASTYCLCEDSMDFGLILGCCSSALGFLISKSLSDAITASMNI